MSVFHLPLAEIARRDGRFAYEAYEFIYSGLEYTQSMLGRSTDPEEPDESKRPNHVTGQQLAHGIRACALEQFGLMARVVLHQWGVHKTADIGQIVFNLIDAGLMSKREEDSVDDFCDVFDFDEAFGQIEWPVGADEW